MSRTILRRIILKASPIWAWASSASQRRPLPEPSNWIPAPAAAINANFDAADIGVHSIVEVAPTATRKMDLRDATRSYAFTLWQSNTAAFGVTIDVTTSGAMGWETDAGVDTDFPIPSFGTGVAAHVLIRVDLPNKRINCIPVT